MKFTYLIGALIIALMMVAPVAAVNEYRDMNPANDVVDPSTYGYVQFFIRAGGSAQDLNVYVQNVKQNLSFDSRWNPDRTDIPGQNGNWMLVEILPDGVSERVLLASGQDYQACLRNGNGNQVECQNFIVGGADITRVVFLGAAVSTHVNKPVVVDESCKDIIVTVTDIERHGSGWFTYYAFDMTVRGNNDGFIQFTNVRIIDDEGHTLFNSPVVVFGNSHYTIRIPVYSSHHHHNPLTVGTGDTTCDMPCHGHTCRGTMGGDYYDGEGYHHGGRN